MKSEKADADGRARLRSLAAVDEVLREPAALELLERYPRPLVVDAVRAVIERLRAEILAAGAAGEASAAQAADLTPAALVPWAARLLEAAVTPSLRRVINATGVVVHTNLGRALLPQEAVDAVVTAASGYTDLEYSLARGDRASRQDHVHDVLCTVTGAEDALAVNNNAAAVLLALAATARGGEVLVARGQLVEIGDGFRIPDILRESGAELVEVGTTNRTYLKDFEQAWTERTRAVLRVHTSNYRIVGFTAEPTLEELAGLAHERGAVLVDDLGSGALAGLALFAEEPALHDSIAAGCRHRDLQRRQAARRPAGRHRRGPGRAPSRRCAATRWRAPCASTSSTSPRSTPCCACTSIRRGASSACRRWPRWRRRSTRCAPAPSACATCSPARARRVAAGRPRRRCVDTVARAGAGALPVTEVPERRRRRERATATPDGLAAALRRGEPAVVCRVHDGRLLFDLRAVRDAELEELAGAVLAALA